MSPPTRARPESCARRARGCASFGGTFSRKAATSLPSTRMAASSGSVAGAISKAVMAPKDV